MSLNTKKWLAIALFTVSLFVLASKLVAPTNIEVVIETPESIVIREIPRLYTFTDGLMIAIFSFLLGSSTYYLLFYRPLPHSSEVPIPVGSEMRNIAKVALRLLDGDERKVFSQIIDAGGEMFQSDLVSALGFSKAKVSRVLDKLEAKDLIMRLRVGMSNKIFLKKNLVRNG